MCCPTAQPGPRAARTHQRNHRWEKTPGKKPSATGSVLESSSASIAGGCGLLATSSSCASSASSPGSSLLPCSSPFLKKLPWQLAAGAWVFTPAPNNRVAGEGKDRCDLQAVATAGWAQWPLPNHVLWDWRWGTPGAQGHRQRGFLPSPQHSHGPKTPLIPPQTPPVCSFCQGKAHHELRQKEQLPDRPFLRGFPSILPCHHGPALSTSGCSPLTISPLVFPLPPHSPGCLPSPCSSPRCSPLGSLAISRRCLHLSLPGVSWDEMDFVPEPSPAFIRGGKIINAATPWKFAGGQSPFPGGRF